MDPFFVATLVYRLGIEYVSDPELSVFEPTLHANIAPYLLLIELEYDLVGHPTILGSSRSKIRHMSPMLNDPSIFPD
jgi:hypothetical protein